ncbi:hypothetical protein BM1_01619 [Bipolaris maydis]|nr:hypothetical protein BM1_01619 [Bipolaris maydis]
MVTSTKRPGLEVVIHVESRPLQEYDDGDENIPPNTVTKYIKAKSGAEFAVITTFKPPFSPLHGDELFGRVSKMNAVHRKIHGEWVVQKIHGEWVVQKIHFSELDIVEEVNGLGPNPTDVKHALSSKGHITLLLHFSDLRTDPDRSSECVVSRRKSHSQYFVSNTDLLASLEALGIVPRDEPMTVPLEDRPEEELTPDELRELVRRMRQKRKVISSRERETKFKGPIKHEQTADDEQATATESRTHKRLQADPQVITID